MSEQLSADEIALYDRQIRLWGTSTQLKLRSTKILVINLGAIGSEIVKNLVLGGINTIEILDNSTIQPQDFAAQFFLPNNDAEVNEKGDGGSGDESSYIGQLKLPLVIEKIRELNNRVNLSINTDMTIDQLNGDYLKKFDLIIATEINNKQEIFQLNKLTRDLNIPMYLTGMHGLFGYIITDLIEHESIVTKPKGNVSRQSGVQLSPNKTIINVTTDSSSSSTTTTTTTTNDNEGSSSGKNELITIKDQFVPIESIFVSKKLPTQLTKKQLTKKLSPVLPLIFTLFEIERPTIDKNTEPDLPSIDIELLKQKSLEICHKFEIPQEIITEQYYEMFSRCAFTEFAPISAIVGGTVAQDVIQYLSGKESPINNVLILDSITLEMPIYLL